MKAVVINSILKWHDKTWNGMEWILPDRRKSCCMYSMSSQYWWFFKCCQNYPPQLCFCGHHRHVTIIWKWGNVYRPTCDMSEMSSSETTAGCCCMKTCPLTTHWRWSSFLLPNWSVWYSNPLPVRFGNSRLFLFPKVKLTLKGRHFNDISNIEHGVTKLLKEVSFQDFQRAFKDLYKLYLNCVKLGGDYIESL